MRNEKKCTLKNKCSPFQLEFSFKQVIYGLLVVWHVTTFELKISLTFKK